jgi:hypothetical protein
MGGSVRLIVAVILKDRVANSNALIADVSSGVIVGGGD